MDQEKHLLSRTLLSGWLPALVTVGAVIATVVNLVITSNTAPLAERISILDTKVLAIDKKLDENDKEHKDWLLRVEAKLDKVLLER